MSAAIAFSWFLAGTVVGILFQKYITVGQIIDRLTARDPFPPLSLTDELPTFDCGDLDPHQRMVALVFGQSNSANWGETPIAAQEAVYSFYQGKCYQAQDPLPGADGDGGSVWTRLGDLLIQQGQYRSVVFVAIGIGGSEIARWTVGGDLHSRLLDTIQQVQAAGLQFTHLLWHQGEADALRSTSKQQYQHHFLEMLACIRQQGVDAPIYVSVASRCGQTPPHPGIQAAQRGLVNPQQKILPGPNTDDLGASDRYDGCHFSAAGLEKVAHLWLEKLTST